MGPDGYDKSTGHEGMRASTRVRLSAGIADVHITFAWLICSTLLNINAIESIIAHHGWCIATGIGATLLPARTTERT